MRYIDVIILALLSFFLFSNNHKQFPKVIPNKCDTIINLSSMKMLPSNPVVYGINIIDSLELRSKNKKKGGSYYSESVSKYKIVENDSLSIYVDTTQSSFHSDELPLFSYLLPPPPPPAENDKDSVFFEEIYKKHFLEREKQRKIHY